MINNINRRDALKFLAGAAFGLTSTQTSGLAQNARLGKLTGAPLFAKYPESFVNVKVPADKPHTTAYAGETPQESTLLLRTQTRRAFHYHQSKLEVAYIWQGVGETLVGNDRYPIGPGQGWVFEPRTSHGFEGKFDIMAVFTPQFQADAVNIAQGAGPMEGRAVSFTFQAPSLEAGLPFAAKLLVEVPAATVTAFKIDGLQAWHYHVSKDEMLMVVAGSGYIQAETSRQKVEPGSIAMIPAGALHKVQGRLELISIMTPAQAGDVRFV
jgi:mannose-6-phosphate isomerase-like protein (cupin superfamily)